MDIDELLEPGGLFKSALFGTLLRDHVDIIALDPGTRVGPYEIEGPLGSGGMGVVYVARRADGQFDRHVAIKFLSRRVADPRLHDDFRRERNIVAALNHAHIAHLLDGGVLEDGRLWFAAELVDGPPIDAYCVEKKLNVYQRVALFCPIVAAVQYAHSQLLIHRDIKPSNVCVDRERGAKLLDFGVATLINDDDAPRAYTPAFASPEQLAGETIGTPSDIWQLGNLLRIVVEAHAEGAAPERIPADLQAIVVKACARSATQRYHTAQGLHDDLVRFLSRDPVRARQPTLPYRSVRFLQRHPFGVGFGVVAAALLIGIGAISWRLGLAQKAANDEQALAEIVANFLKDDLIAQADPFGGSGHSSTNLGDVLVRVSEHAAITFANRPRLASDIDRSLANTLGDMSRYDDSMRIVSRALARLDAAAPENFELVAALKLVRAEDQISLGQNSGARRDLEQLYDDASKRLGANAALALQIQITLAKSYRNESRFQECVRSLRDPVAHAGKLEPIDSLVAFGILSQCSVQTGDYAQAKEMAAAQAKTSATLYGGTDPRTFLFRAAAMSVAIQSGEFSNALAEAPSLLDQIRTSLGTDTELAGRVTQFAGHAAVCSGDQDRALANLEESRRIMTNVFGERSSAVAAALIDEGLAYERQGKFQDSNQVLDRAASIARAHPEDLSVLSFLASARGELRLAESRYADAASEFHKASEYSQEVAARNPLRGAHIKLGLAAAYLHIGRSQDAQTLIKEAMPIVTSRPTCWQPLVNAVRVAQPATGP